MQKKKKKKVISFVNLNVKCSAAELGAGLVIELQPSLILIKASTFPLNGVVFNRSRADVSGEEVHGGAERVEKRPGELSGQEREKIPRVKW